MEITSWQLAVIALTIAAVIGGGMWAGRQVDSADGYSLGSRSAGVGLVAGSALGTCVGGGATVGTAQLAATVGLSAWWFTIGTGLCLIIMGIFYAPRLRNSTLATVPEFLTQNYGAAAGNFSVAASSVGILLSAVASTLPGISIIAALFRVTPWEAGLLLMLLVALYSLFGGMKSAGASGILKMAVIWLSLSLCGCLAAYELFTTAAGQGLPAFPWFSMAGEGYETIFNNLFSLIVGILCTQTYIQIIFSAANPRTAAVGLIVAAFITMPVGLPCALIGIYMHSAHPEVAPILALPYYLLHHGGVVGSMAMGGLVLSIVSSVAGLSLGVGTMLARDFLARILAGERGCSLLTLTRSAVLAVILCATVIAVLNEGSQILFWNYFSMALRGGGIFLPLTLAVFAAGAVEPRWAVASMVFSTLTALAAAFFALPVNPLFLGLAVSAFILILGRRRDKKSGA